MSDELLYLIGFGVCCFLAGVLVAEIVYGNWIIPPRDKRERNEADKNKANQS